jgi:hypothetical protein
VWVAPLTPLGVILSAIPIFDSEEDALSSFGVEGSGRAVRDPPTRVRSGSGRCGRHSWPRSIEGDYTNTVFVVGADRISTDLHNLIVLTNNALPKPLTLDYELRPASRLRVPTGLSSVTTRDRAPASALRPRSRRSKRD